jgi:hypothetical protein
MSMSVRLTTPTRRPEIPAPGSAAAEIDGPVGVMKGALGEESVTAEDGSEAIGALTASGGVT